MRLEPARSDPLRARHSRLLVRSSAVRPSSDTDACLGPERLRVCCESYVYFGLREIASLVDAATEAEETDETEDTFNDAYWAHAQNDDVIAERFERDITAHPERYAL